MSQPPPNQVVRSTVICARRETVFRYFTDSERFAAWWGAGSRIDARPGGALLIVYPGGATASGQVQEVVPGERVVFTYGYDDAKKGIAPGGSTVQVTFADVPGGTRVTLTHVVGSPELARAHEPGWRFQLSLFAKVASAEQHAGAEAIVDQWFAAWAERDAARRRGLLEACATPSVTFRDDFAALEGLEDLDRHIAMTHVHMPGMRLARSGPLQQSQGAALVRWQALRPDGTAAGAGTSFVDLAPDGHIARVAGFWGV
jgi:uncharacterized protein YndB with AHSA1/START domain